MTFKRTYEGTQLVSLTIDGLDTNVFLTLMHRMIMHVHGRGGAPDIAMELDRDFPSMFALIHKLVVDHLIAEAE